ISLESTVGRGSCFAVAVPRVDAPRPIVKPPSPARAPIDLSKLVVVIDDDPLVLEGMGGLFQSWGCRVVTASTDDGALAGSPDRLAGGAAAVLANRDHPRDVSASDYHLPGVNTGVPVIESLRKALPGEIPAFLASGDTNPESMREPNPNVFYLLHKPVDPMAL